jgi:fatty acid desaturase
VAAVTSPVPPAPDAAAAELAALRHALRQAGIFRTRPWMTLLALPANLVAAFACFWLAARAPLVLSVPVFVAGSFLFYRLGWLMHDAAHGGAFAHPGGNRAWTRLVAALLGEFPSGWKHGHNRHHHAPNVRGVDGDQAERWDPSRRYAGAARAFAGLFLTNRRGRVVLPTSLLFLGLRDGWYCFAHHRRRFVPELAGVLGGIALQAGTFAALFGAWGVPLFLLHTHLGMLYLNSAFAGNHYDLESFDREAGLALPYAERQLRATRNYTPGWLSAFVFGGLEYQIEHHLFPSMPRHQLRHAAPLVRQFAQAQGLPYREDSFARSFARVLAFHVASPPGGPR